MKKLLLALCLLISFNSNAQFLKEIYKDFLKYGTFYVAGDASNAYEQTYKDYFVERPADDDLYGIPKVIDEKVMEMKTEAKKEFDYIQSIGGAVVGIENSYLKQQLVNSNKERIQNINDGKQVVVGVNKFTETESSPLTA